MILPLFEFLRHLPSNDTSLMFSKAAGPYLFKVKQILIHNLFKNNKKCTIKMSLTSFTQFSSVSIVDLNKKMIPRKHWNKSTQTKNSFISQVLYPNLSHDTFSFSRNNSKKVSTVASISFKQNMMVSPKFHENFSGNAKKSVNLQMNLTLHFATS